MLHADISTLSASAWRSYDHVYSCLLMTTKDSANYLITLLSTQYRLCLNFRAVCFRQGITLQYRHLLAITILLFQQTSSPSFELYFCRQNTAEATFQADHMCVVMYLVGKLHRGSALASQKAQIACIFYGLHSLQKM